MGMHKSRQSFMRAAVIRRTDIRHGTRHRTLGADTSTVL